MRKLYDDWTSLWAIPSQNSTLISFAASRPVLVMLRFAPAGSTRFIGSRRAALLSENRQGNQAYQRNAKQATAIGHDQSSFSRLGKNKPFSTRLTSASTMAPTKAARNPCTSKPGTNHEASSIMSALMTNQKMPKVTSVMGKVMIFSNKPSVALMKPITITATSAAKIP